MKILVALCALAAATPALADDNPFAKENVVVSLAGLNLSTVAGQRALDQRLSHAAAQVCGEGMSRIHLAAENKSRACRAEVVADYRAQLAARKAKTSLASAF
jgi:UrcA family protein